jgi:hypothetical protein
MGNLLGDAEAATPLANYNHSDPLAQIHAEHLTPLRPPFCTPSHTHSPPLLTTKPPLTLPVMHMCATTDRHARRTNSQGSDDIRRPTKGLTKCTFQMKLTANTLTHLASALCNPFQSPGVAYIQPRSTPPFSCVTQRWPLTMGVVPRIANCKRVTIFKFSVNCTDSAMWGTEPQGAR